MVVNNTTCPRTFIKNIPTRYFHAVELHLDVVRDGVLGCEGGMELAVAAVLNATRDLSIVNHDLQVTYSALTGINCNNTHASLHYSHQRHIHTKWSYSLSTKTIQLFMLYSLSNSTGLPRLAVGRRLLTLMRLLLVTKTR